MKLRILLIVLSLPFFNFGQISGNNLIACYEFEGNTLDAISGYDGTLVGNANVTTSFNTQLNDEDALSIPGDMINQVSEFTISMMVKFNGFNISSTSSANCILSGASSTNDNLLNFVYVKDQAPGGSVTLTNMFYYLHENTRYEFPNISLNTDQWYHVSLVRGINNIKLYVDGVIQSPTDGHTVPSLNLTLHTDGFIFGQDQDILAGGYDVNQCMNGSIDNLTVYDRELDSQEVNYLYTTTDGCRVLSLSDNNDKSKELKIYPNPATDYIRIETPEITNKSIQYNIFCSLGKKCAKGTVQNNEKIDISHLNPGVYFMSIDSEYGFNTVKIIKK